MSAYYNEIDPFAAQWLRNLIAGGHIAPGDVDERSIKDVRPDDLRGYAQCHFFAGIGGWSYALRLAGIPDDRPVWTGSCPCQPFSAAGKGKGADDARHLWPDWFRLIRECRPSAVFGEQVASAIGHGWLDLVFDDLEAEEYACGAVVLPACSVGAPHIRQRLWFVADSERGAAERYGHDMAGAAQGTEGEVGEQRFRDDVGNGGDAGELADADSERRDRKRLLLRAEEEGRNAGEVSEAAGSGETGELAFSYSMQSEQPTRTRAGPGEATGGWACREFAGSSHLDAWADIEWLPRGDGKARPTQPGLQPLAHGVSGRVGRLRCYGNAIVPQVASAFIDAALAARERT